MKNFFKLTLAVALLFVGATSAHAQKFGRVDLSAIVTAMPEFAEANKNLETYGKDLQDQLEQIKVEFNQKLSDYEKSMNTLTDTIRQMKESELQQLQQRYADFQQIAQQDMQKKQAELMAPIVEKANGVVSEVAKAGGYLAVFNIEGDVATSAGLAYFDAAQLTSITDQVLAKLGIEAKK